RTLSGFPAPPLLEGVHSANGSVVAIMLKVFTQDFRQTIGFCVRPEMRIEPTQLVSSASPNRTTDYGFVRIENGKLPEEFFSFAEGIGKFQNGMAAYRPCRGGHKFHNGLMRYPDGIGGDTISENVLGCFLFVWKPPVKTVNQDVGINESGHACRDPLASTPCLQFASYSNCQVSRAAQ